MKRPVVIALLLALLLPGVALAHATATALVRDGDGALIGTTFFEEVAEGTRLTLIVEGIAVGAHGFHVHQVGSCEASVDGEGRTVLFGGAGGHFDPHGAGSHAGPLVDAHAGHAGDMPNLVVDESGLGVLSFVTDRIALTEGDMGVLGRSIIIHANEDNYSDEPALGGSGARIACGLILASPH